MLSWCVHDFNNSLCFVMRNNYDWLTKMGLSLNGISVKWLVNKNHAQQGIAKETQIVYKGKSY